MQAPSVFTGPKQMPWYRARGHWLEAPTLFLQKGAWTLDVPQSLKGEEALRAGGRVRAACTGAVRVGTGR